MTKNELVKKIISMEYTPAQLETDTGLAKIRFDQLMKCKKSFLEERVNHLSELGTSEPVPAQETAPAKSDTMQVTTYVINDGTSSQYYGLKTVENNEVLTCAPNNWKTEKGAINWAKKHGYVISEKMPNPAPIKRKKLTEKEWKKQLEAKAAFEAAEKEAARTAIESRYEIGARLSDGSKIIEVNEEHNPYTNEDSIYIISSKFTENKYNTFCYDADDFLNGDIAFEEITEPEQPDENQLTFDEVTTYSATDTAAAVPAPASPIDETAAKRGHEAYSFSDYKAGSATAEYNAAVADVRAAAEEVRERIPEEYRGELDRLVNRYAAKLADWTNRKNRADASCPSWFITGAANYPHRKHEKQMRRLDKLFKEYDSITALENRIKNFAYECKHRPIKAGDASAADKLRAKVEELSTLQEQMKRNNAEARKRGEAAPYAAWALSNNLRNLKRYADRLAALEKAKVAPTAQADHIEGEDFRVVRNTEIMRLQFLFDGKPDERIRAVLKSNGFKWAPSQMAWQRQLTANAERAARTVAEAIQ